jgi:Glycosyl hydrolases family 43
VRVRATHVFLAVALLGLPAEAHGRTLELERGRLSGAVRVVEDRAAGGGRAVALSGPGSIRRRFATRHGFSALLLRARALPCTGRRPRVALHLDGRRMGTRQVRSRRFAPVRFRVVAAAGPKTAELRLANPGTGRSCRRTAVLDWLRVVERPPPPLSPSADLAAPSAEQGAAPPAGQAATAPPARPGAGAPGSPAPAGTYQNPVFAAPGAPDPGVLDVGSAHSDYFVFSTGNLFPMLRSPDLVNWTRAGTALQARPDWAASTDWNPWAPSVIERDGPCPDSDGQRCFVLFHVSRHATLAPATNCIGVAVSPRPEGPYRELGPLTGGGLDASGRPPGCGDDLGYSNIDPAPFVDGDGRAYLYVSTGRRCQTPAPGAACPWDRTISVIPLASDLLSASGPRLPLFDAESAGWEVGSFGPVVENPWPVKSGSTYVLLYSGGAYTGRYGMGYATSSSPTGPFVKSAGNPILAEAAGVLSPGGGMLATGPRGGSWLVYHGRRDRYSNPRELRIDPLRFPTESTVAVDGPTSAPQAGAP